MGQSVCHATAAALDGVAVVIFHTLYTVGLQNQGICAERRKIDVREDVLGVNSLTSF